MENVGFPIRIDLYLSSFGFLKKNIHTQDQPEIMLTNAFEMTCSLEIAYNNIMINIEK